MDKIWYRNPSKSEVIGRCGGDEIKAMTTQNRQSRTPKKLIVNIRQENANMFLHDTTEVMCVC